MLRNGPVIVPASARGLVDTRAADILPRVGGTNYSAVILINVSCLLIDFQEVSAFPLDGGIAIEVKNPRGAVQAEIVGVFVERVGVAFVASGTPFTVDTVFTGVVDAEVAHRGVCRVVFRECERESTS